MIDVGQKRTWCEAKFWAKWTQVICLMWMKNGWHWTHVTAVYYAWCTHTHTRAYVRWLSRNSAAKSLVLFCFVESILFFPVRKSPYSTALFLFDQSQTMPLFWTRKKTCKAPNCMRECRWKILSLMGWFSFV